MNKKIDFLFELFFGNCLDAVNLYPLNVVIKSHLSAICMLPYNLVTDGKL